MRQKTTIYDIAKEAGVSPSTVSRALSQPGRISAKTEFRIRRIAEQLGYLAPDGDADGDRLPSTGMMAVIVPTLRNSLYATIANTLQRRLETKGVRADHAGHGREAGGRAQGHVVCDAQRGRRGAGFLASE
ncbi:LacI family DNA-binding transcriptional regulator [Bifidobacterium callitrichos]|uniref:LacI family DNA-binding transcriptional regulator n=1 Tax=Bifidobacterium callitrichos TaxID=762209 RepID=UPI001CC3069A|nr:LacI family DNA-binding transcriptional regulator [Bifidobacterium callitrichos]